MGSRVLDAMSSEKKLKSFSVPKFLPETIITLSMTLPHEDQEVLFYLIACSLKALSMENNQGKNSRRDRNNNSSHGPSFDCNCFECYVNFWGRWNVSPNRDLIHKAIDMFEDHIAGNETASESRKNGKKMKARENKLHAKELITWLESNSDLGQEIADVEGEEKLIIGKSDQSSDYVGKVEKSRPQLKYCFHTVGLDKSYMRRMVLPLMGFLTENLWTVWSPLK